MMSSGIRPYLIAVLVILKLDGVLAQVNEGPITKMGGFIYPQRGVRSDYSVNLEREINIPHWGAFTHGLRIDYNAYSSFLGQRRLAAGYELKAYPFHRRAGKPFNGVFVGLDPFHYLKVENRSMYGPGVGTVLGYQYLFKKRFSLAFEASMVYFHNVNENVSPFLRTNEADRYFDFFVNIKIGIRRGGP